MINRKNLLYLTLVLIFLIFLAGRFLPVTPKDSKKNPARYASHLKNSVPLKADYKSGGAILLYRLVLLGSVGFIIYLLVRPQSAKISGGDLFGLRLDNQKLKSQNEGLNQQLNLQNEEAKRLVAFLQEKESTIKTMLASEGFLSKSFSDFRKQLNELQVEKGRLAKQLGEKENELQTCKQQLKKRKIRLSFPRENKFG